MKLYRQKIYQLMVDHFGGNYNRFAKELGVSISHMHRFITKGIGGGRHIFTAIMSFCKEKGLDFDEYINWEDKEEIFEVPKVEKEKILKSQKCEKKIPTYKKIMPTDKTKSYHIYYSYASKNERITIRAKNFREAIDEVRKLYPGCTIKNELWYKTQR